MARDAKRVVLDRAAVVAGAVELADEAGLEPLTIRRLADRLGVRPMTMYHYVDGKDDIVDGMVGQVFDEIERPDPGIPWKESIRRRACSLRTALRRHPWAIPLMESRRTPGADILDHHEAVLATWLGAGFELPVVAHGMAVVDAFVYGFALQESALPFGERDADLAEISGDIAAHLAPDDYPALTRFTAEHVMRPGYDFGDSFEVGLEIVLDGIERLAVRSGGQ